MPLSFGSPRVLQAMQAAMERGSSARRNAAQASRARKAATRAQGIARARVGQAGDEHECFVGIEIERFCGMCHAELPSLKYAVTALCAQARGPGLGHPTGLPDPVMLRVQNASGALQVALQQALQAMVAWNGAVLDRAVTRSTVAKGRSMRISRNLCLME